MAAKDDTDKPNPRKPSPTSPSQTALPRLNQVHRSSSIRQLQSPLQSQLSDSMSTGLEGSVVSTPGRGFRSPSSSSSSPSSAGAGVEYLRVGKRNQNKNNNMIPRSDDSFPSTPVTSSSSRRRLSMNLLAKISVFESGTDYYNSSNNNLQASFSRLVDSTSPAAAAAATTTTTNPGMPPTTTYTDTGPAPTTPQSVKASRRQSRASILIQQFNDKAAISPLPITGPNSLASGAIPSPSSTPRKLLNPTQVRELVRLSGGSAHLKAYEQISLSSSSSPLLQTNTSPKGRSNATTKTITRGGPNSKHHQPLQMLPGMVAPFSFQGDDDHNDDNDHFNDNLNNNSQYESADNKDDTKQKKNNRDTRILLNAKEVKALIHANAKSKLFQLVNEWERFSHGKAHQESSSHFVTNNDDTNDHKQQQQQHYQRRQAVDDGAKSRAMQDLPPKKWKQGLFYAQKQKHENEDEDGEETLKKQMNLSSLTSDDGEMDVPAGMPIPCRQRLAPPPPSTVSRMFAAAMTQIPNPWTTAKTAQTTATPEVMSASMTASMTARPTPDAAAASTESLSSPSLPPSLPLLHLTSSLSAVHQTVRPRQPLEIESFVPPKFENKSQEQQQLIATTVEENFVFSAFRRQGGKARMENTWKTLVDAFEPCEAMAGNELTLSQEESNQHFYVVEKGQVDIVVNGVIVGKAKRGACFGEQGLLHGLLNHDSMMTTTTGPMITNLLASADLDPHDKNKKHDDDEMTNDGNDNVINDNVIDIYDDDRVITDNSDVDDKEKQITRVLRLHHTSFRGIIQSAAAQAMDAKRAMIRGIDFLRPLLEYDNPIEDIDCSTTSNTTTSTDITLLNQLAELFQRQEFFQDEKFVIKRDSSFVVVQAGSLQLTDESGNWSVRLGPSEYYGQQALLGISSTSGDVATGGGTKITMTGIVADTGVFYSMDREAMIRLLGGDRLAQLQDWNSFTQSIPLLGCMGLKRTDEAKKGLIRRGLENHIQDTTDKMRDSLAQQIKRKKYQTEGKNVLQDESPHNPSIYVVREGQVLVKYTDPKGAVQEKVVSVDEVFGNEHLTEVNPEDALFSSRASDYSAQVTGSGPVSVGVLPIKAIVEGHVENGEESPMQVSSDALTITADDHGALQRKIRQAVKANIRLKDLEKISLLGEGQYGEVWLVEVEAFHTGVDSLKQRFALKSQYKIDDIRGEDALDAIRSEIEILETLTQTAPHPGIVNYINTYEDEKCIYMLMGLITGGDLWSRIHRQDSEGNWMSGMPESAAKFYTYVVADTLGFMHSQQILFRDLKPENVMLDDDGYPVLVDFGFAKSVPDGEKTFTFCGTPNYVAPEIILHLGHGKAVDYWALGVTMYEMVSGENPFYYDGIDQVTLYDTIVGEQFYDYSEPTSKELLDLTYQLLEKESNQRLGSLTGGHKDILSHAWFVELNLADICSKRIVAPLKPTSDKKVDVDGDAMEEILACFVNYPEQAEGVTGTAEIDGAMSHQDGNTRTSLSNSSYTIDQLPDEDPGTCQVIEEERNALCNEKANESDEESAKLALSTALESEPPKTLRNSIALSNSVAAAPVPVASTQGEKKSSTRGWMDHIDNRFVIESPLGVEPGRASPRKYKSRQDKERSKKERRSAVRGALMDLGLES